MTHPSNKLTRPLILVTSLFFLWGMAYGLLDVLNKHFQLSFSIGKRESALLQAAYFGAYFLMAIPAGRIMRKWGYKKGIIGGLLLYALGAFLFYPAAGAGSFHFFLAAVFILASGLTFLETAANPFITVLGEPSRAAFRLNLSQSFNGVGSFLGPLIGGLLFFGNDDPGSRFGMVKTVYLVIAAVVLLVAVLFVITDMPEPDEEELQHHDAKGTAPLLQQPHFIGAVIAQFFYVAAQVGVAAMFINYCTEQHTGLDNSRAAYYLSLGMILFTIGRFTGTTLMRFIRPQTLLAVYALANVVLCTVISNASGIIGIYALVAVFFFESIMFPTIFALGIRDLGHRTKSASSLIIMSIVGGALIPYIMGAIADSSTTAHSYTVPMICFAVVAWYGIRGYRTAAR